jgi:Protein of unknown function (DUF1579)
MSWRNTVTVAVVVGAAAFAAGRGWSEDEKASTDEENMKKMIEMSTPVEQHKKLAALVGTWDAEMTMYEPGKEPQKAKGVSTTTSCLNGLFVMTEYKGEMGPMTFEGRGFDGYSKEHKKYFTFWADTMGTTPMILWGTEEGKTVTYDGDLYLCAMGNYTPRIKITRDDADHSSFEFWAKFEGASEYAKLMESKYTRRK